MNAAKLVGVLIAKLAISYVVYKGSMMLLDRMYEKAVEKHEREKKGIWLNEKDYQIV